MFLFTPNLHRRFRVERRLVLLRRREVFVLVRHNAPSPRTNLQPFLSFPLRLPLFTVAAARETRFQPPEVVRRRLDEAFLRRRPLEPAGRFEVILPLLFQQTLRRFPQIVMFLHFAERRRRRAISVFSSVSRDQNATRYRT